MMGRPLFRAAFSWGPAMTFQKLTSSLWRGAAVTSAALMLGFTALPAAAQEVTLFTWDGFQEPAFMEEYVAKHKKPPEVAIFADEDEAFAKLRAGYKPDIMAPCSYEISRWKDAGLIQPIDIAKLKNWDQIPAALKAIPGIDAGDGKVWFVPQYWGATSVAIRPDLAPEYAKSQSWNILWDPKYKGRVSAMEGVADTVAVAAKNIGVNPYNMSKDEWGKVQARLREMVKNLRVVTSDRTQISEGLKSGELVAAIVWPDSIAPARNEGVKLEFLKNPPAGFYTYACGFVIHKDSKNPKVYDLINSQTSVTAGLHMIKEQSLGAANLAALKAANPKDLEARGIPGTAEAVETFLRSGTFQERMKNLEEIVQVWGDIRAGL